jgi:hypothetical protein
MSERTLLVASWGAIAAAMIAMAIGHSGATDLNWMANQISTYAAQAPHQEWVTAGMLLPCVAFACIGMLISRHRILGDSIVADAAPLLAGAAIAGLTMLATVKEAAPTMASLQHAGVEAITQQSFHNAGLMIFFYSTILMVLLCGGLAALQARHWAARLGGAASVLLGLAALPLMSEPWPSLLGIGGPVHGLMQRASLFSLWLAAALILAAARPPALATDATRRT